MPFNSNVIRDDVGALIPEEASREILQTVSEGSVFLRLARRMPNMTRAQRRLPVLQVLPTAYFVGEAGRSPQTFDSFKQTTEMAWGNKFLNVEEIACIVPIPESVLEDADYDIWSEIRPQIIAAIGAVIDTAVFFGTSDTDVPATWPDGILVDMPADHVVEEGSVTVDGRSDLYNDIFAEDGVLSKVEEDGFFVNGHVAAMRLRAKLRQLRDDNGQPLFVQSMQGTTSYSLDGQRLEFPLNGAFDPTQALLLSGDWNQVVWALRKDISYKLITEGVITDNANPPVIIYNLPQQDMVALRITFRMAWQIANVINRLNTDANTRYPFAALAPVGS
jgi:HK97 family phage major capsid protein